MPAPPSLPKGLIEKARRALGAPDRWLDDPRVEFSVYLALIVLAPLMTPGLDLIVKSLSRLFRGA